MASNERKQWTIPASAGVKDINGDARMLTVRLVNGGLVFYASVAGDDDLVDTRTSLSMPDEVAKQIADFLWAAVETNQQRGV